MNFEGPRNVDKRIRLSYIQNEREDVERISEMDDDKNHDEQTQDEQALDETPIDLNVLFSEDKRDLNRLFPDSRVRRFLKDLQRNRRDVEGFLKRLEFDGEVSEKSGGDHEVS